MMKTYKPTRLISIKKSNNNKGFTLLELLMAVVIFTIIVTLIINEYIGQQGQSITSQQAVEMQQTARASMFLISKNIRKAGFDPAGSNNAGITNAGDGSIGNPLDISYNVDFGEDGIDNNSINGIDDVAEQGTGFTLETLTYVLADPDGDGDTDLVVEINGGGNQFLAENISTLNFTYLDETNTATATLADIRSIQVTTTVTTDSNELDRTMGNNNTRTLTAIFKCRNLGL